MKKNIYKNILDNAQFGFAYHKIILDDNGKPVDYVFLEVNKAFEKITGLKASNVVDKKVSDIFPGIDKSEFNWIECFGETALKGGKKELVQYFDPLEKWFEVQVYSDEKEYFTVIFEDITKEKLSKADLEEFFNISLDLFCIADAEGSFIKVNKEWENLLGYPVAELQQRKFLDFVHPDDLDDTVKAMKQLSVQDKVLQFVNRFRAKDGTYRFIEWRSNPKGKLIFAAARDVTEQIEAESGLKDREEKYRTIFESANDAIFVMKDDKFIDCNDKTLEIFKCSKEDIINKEPYIFSPENQPDGRESREKALEKINAAFKGIPQVFEWVHITKAGDPFYAEVSLNKYSIDNNDYILAVVRDSTERKHSEEQIRKSEENLLITLNSIGDAVISTDNNGLVMQMNPVAEKLTGWLLFEAKGKLLTEVFRIINSETREVATNPVETVLKEGEIVGLANHTALISKNGKEYQISDSAAPIKDNDGNITGVVLVFSDVTEDYALRQAISQNEKKYRGLFNSINDAISLNEIVYKDRKPVDYIIIDVNNTFEKQTGISKDQAIGRFASSLYEEDPPPFLDIFAETVETGIPKSFETHFLKHNKYYHISVFSPEKGRFATVYQDITVRKKAEQALETERSQLLSIFDSIDESIYVSDTDTYEILFANQVLIDLLGKNPVGELCYKSLQGFDSPCPFCTNDIIKKQSPFPYQWEHYNPIIDKTYRLHDRMMRWTDGRRVRFEIAVDITDLKKAEESLKHSEELFRTLADTTTSAIFIFKGEKFVYVNNSTEKITGYSKEEFLEFSNIADIVHKDHKEIISDFSEIRRIISKSEANNQANYEMKIICKDGSEKWADFTAVVINWEGQMAILGTAIDITEKKKAEEMLRFQATMLDQIGDLVTATDLEGKIIYINEAETKLLGKSKEEILGQTIEMYGEDKFKGATQREILKKTIKKGEWRGEVINYDKDGNPVTLDCRTWVIKDDSGNDVLCGVSTDITERKAMEKALRDSEERAQLQRKEIVKLVFDHAIVTGELDNALRKVTETLAFTIGVERASIWLLEEDGAEMKCLSLFEAKKQKHSKGAVLKIDEMPGYFNTIISESRIYVEDAQNDPRTSELAIDYLIPLGITSMLDAGILIEGSLVGVVCLEHIGGKRKWHSDEEAFAGTAAAIVAQVLTIIKRKNAEIALRNSEEKYRLFFEKSPLGIFHFDNKGVITECNDIFVSIIGSSREALIGLNMIKLPDERIVKSLNKVLTGKSAAFEGNYSSATADKITPVRVLFTPVFNKDSEVDGGIGLVEDRSDYIAKEKLEKQVAVAKESAKFKQNFLANMSHEIRTPLTGIMGLIEIMQKEQLSPQLQEYVKILKSSSENLNEIIDQVLDFSKIEAGKVKLKTRAFKIDSLLKNARELFDSLCTKKYVKFKIVADKNLPEFIDADDKRLSQIVNNLISNAVKFIDKGTITIKAELVMHDSKTDEVIIKIEVEDTGIGIPAEKQEKLFAPFAQIDEQDRRVYEGTGLGLSICKELANLHGGEIGVQSKLNEGSMFWFTFTAKKARSKITDIKEDLEQHKVSDKKLRILFAEDKLVNQKVVKLMLTSMGHEVVLAQNGQQAIEMYKPGMFDMILMDIQMPVMDGIAATKELKKNYKDLPPIVGLSANAFEGDREKYMAQGLDEYLTKPVKGKEFENMLKKFGIA